MKYWSALNTSGEYLAITGWLVIWCIVGECWDIVVSYRYKSLKHLLPRGVNEQESTLGTYIMTWRCWSQVSPRSLQHSLINSRYSDDAMKRTCIHQWRFVITGTISKMCIIVINLMPILWMHELFQMLQLWQFSKYQIYPVKMRSVYNSIIRW